MKTYNLTVEGMTCPHCEQTIEKAVKEHFKEVLSIKADRTKKLVSLTALKDINLEELSEIINKLGYKVVKA